METARATLEALLRNRRLDRTLRGTEASASWPVASTGVPELDARLGGGLPRGQTSELVGVSSSGRTGLLHGLMAAATRRGEAVALIDTLDRFDPRSAAERGTVLSRLLWIRGRALSPGVLAQPRARCTAPVDLVAQALDRAVKAAGLVTQAGGFGLVALDLADVPRHALLTLPFTTWFRLQRALEGSETVLMLVVTDPVARSARGVSLLLQGTPRWRGTSDRARVFGGIDAAVQIAGSLWTGDERLRTQRRAGGGDLRVLGS